LTEAEKQWWNELGIRMTAVRPRFRFGSFEFDPGSGELFRQGHKLKFQRQLSVVLAMLVEHAGSVVSREELRKTLWPDDTFVDFDRGLNKAINGVRASLRDSARKPRFVETLPHKGYRFIALVETAAFLGNVPVATTSASRIQSLAVLPLANQSGDPAQEYFSDGMTEELICAVSRIGSLRVISRTSVMRYKGTRKSLPAIARELCVDAVVEGSVGRSGSQVRITAQLIYAPEDRHLWSGRYERELCDVLQMQAEIAESIASQINKVIEPGKTSGRARPIHPQAYEACLKGNFFRDKMTPADLEKSVQFFTGAIDLDPEYAQAYADLSQSFFFLGVFGIAPPGDVFPKAKAAAVKALELDEALTAAHNALAAVHILYDWDWAKAEAQCHQAIQLSPGSPVARAHMADFMSIQGRHDEAVAEFRRVLALDPISRVYLGHFGLILYRARRYDEAIEQCQKALEVDANYANALWFLAISLEQKGRLAESIAILEKATGVSGGGLHYRALLGRAYALAGERQRSGAIVEELEALSKAIYVSPFDIAIVYLGLGDKTSAFRWLEEAYRQRVFRLIELTMPMFDDLRRDPRWENLVKRIGLLA
jgi:TolB-like protein/Flp pilus assembly protein TadD